MTQHRKLKAANGYRKFTNFERSKNGFGKDKSWRSNLSTKPSRRKQVAGRRPAISGSHVQIDREIEAFAKMFEQRVAEGWKVSLLSFMFKSLSGSRKEKLELMKHEIERVYYRLQKQTVRYGRKQRDKVPVFLAAPDLADNMGSQGLIIFEKYHDGLHMHAAVVTPPSPRYESSLEDHLNSQLTKYVPMGGILIRLHCLPYTQNHGNAVRYALKGLHVFGRDELLAPGEKTKKRGGSHGT